MQTENVHYEEAERLLHHVHLLDTVAVKIQNGVLAKLDLTVQQMITLREIFLCEENGNLATQRTIEHFLCATNPSVTGLLQGMEKKGLIERKINSKDQRQKLLAVTEKGRQLVEEGTVVLHEMESVATEGMSPEEILQFQGLLAKAIHNLNQHK